jgi:quercetin dioxygenase-like cupin family protein
VAGVVCPYELELGGGEEGRRLGQVRFLLTMAYFDRSGEASDEAGRWAHFSHLPALNLVPGIAFQPITTDSVMTNFVTFEPDAVADMHHHSEQQIAIVISGELTFTVGDETRVTHAGDCVVIPPHVPHGGHAGPEGCTAIDVFTPPRAGIVDAMTQ